MVIHVYNHSINHLQICAINVRYARLAGLKCTAAALPEGYAMDYKSDWYTPAWPVAVLIRPHYKRECYHQLLP